MCDQVVKLAGDAGPLGVHGPLRLRLAFPFQVLRPFLEKRQVLPAALQCGA